MITLSDVSVEFHGKSILEEVNFSINRGERLGLVGRNGSGKSTILKVLLGQLPLDHGKILIPDGYTTGYLQQHFDFKHNTVIDEICSILPPDREYETWKAESILFGLGFSYEMTQQDPKTFSGGYQVKINLAKMLLMESNLILLDEPTNYLDIYSIRWLKEFLKKWSGELILITHDRAFMDSIITHSLVIHRKKIRKIKGSPAKIKEQIALEEEIYEKTRVAEEEKRKEMQDWIAKFGSKASKASQVQSRVKMLEKQDVKEKLEKIPTLDFKFTYTPFTNKTEMVKVNNLTFGYDKNNPLIKDLSFDVVNQDVVCIIGKNGSGKSTLLQIIAKELDKDNSCVIMNEFVKPAYFGQMNISRLNNKNTIIEEMESVKKGLDYSYVRRICSNMLFGGDLAKKKIEVLSGGEKGRVMLGKILLQESNMLLLDEPTNHFDMESCEALMEAIQEYKGAVLMVTHDEDFLHKLATKLVVFDGGETFFFNGGYEQFLKQIGWRD